MIQIRIWNSLSVLLATALHGSIAVLVAAALPTGQRLPEMGQPQMMHMEVNLAQIEVRPVTVEPKIHEPIPVKPKPAVPGKKQRAVYFGPEKTITSEPVIASERPPAPVAALEAVHEQSKAMPPASDMPVAETAPLEKRPEPQDDSLGIPSTPPGLSSPIRPRYPRSSRLNKEEGEVTLRFLVRENGRANDIRIVKSSGFERLDRAACKAVRTHDFIPAVRGEDLMEAPCTLTIRFHLNQRRHS